MCAFSKPSIPAPEPAPIPETPPVVTSATTKNDAPKMADSASSVETSTAQKKRRGRGSLRIPLTSSGLSGSGLNFPTS